MKKRSPRLDKRSSRLDPRSPRLDTRSPRLDLSRRREPAPARVMGRLVPSGDPLTGFRGQAEGDAVAAQLGSLLLLVRLLRDEAGLVLRGQVSASIPESIRGALVHARGTEGAALAAVDTQGEFMLRGWRGDLVALDIENEEGAWRLAWPGEDAPPRGDSAGEEQP